MTLSDYAAAFTLVGVRHRHAKPAWAYSTVAPPPWLTVGLGDGSNGEGVAGPGQQYTPPAVMEISAVAQGTQLQLRSPTPMPGMLGAGGMWEVGNQGYPWLPLVHVSVHAGVPMPLTSKSVQSRWFRSWCSCPAVPVYVLLSVTGMLGSGMLRRATQAAQTTGCRLRLVLLLLAGAKAAEIVNGSAAPPTADSTSIPPSSSDATLHTTNGTSSKTTTTTSITAISGSSSNSTATAAPAPALPTTASPFSTLITNAVTTTEPHAVKEPHQLPVSPGSSQPNLPQYGSSSAQTHTTSKPAADASTGTRTVPSFRRDLSMARVFKGQLSHVTREVFGLALLPGGDTPSLLDPCREWSGDKAEANVSMEVRGKG